MTTTMSAPERVVTVRRIAYAGDTHEVRVYVPGVMSATKRCRSEDDAEAFAADPAAQDAFLNEQRRKLQERLPDRGARR